MSIYSPKELQPSWICRIRTMPVKALLSAQTFSICSFAIWTCTGWWFNGWSYLPSCSLGITGEPLACNIPNETKADLWNLMQRIFLEAEKSETVATLAQTWSLCKYVHLGRKPLVCCSFFVRFHALLDIWSSSVLIRYIKKCDLYNNNFLKAERREATYSALHPTAPRSNPKKVALLQIISWANGYK